jgi:two-component system chemotaxis response regulator CheB
MSLAAAVPAPPAPARKESLRVMVVDDSVVIRGMISRWIEAEPDLEVVASLRTGRDAVNQIDRIKPDVAVLDIEMPELDGIAALPLLLEKQRDLVIIMASTLTRRNAEISLKALSLGAADYIPKPESTREAGTVDILRHDLLQKIRHLGQARKRVAAPRAPQLAPSRPIDMPGKAASRVEPVAHAPASFTLRPFAPSMPRALLIGSSTGGPQALMALVAQLGQVIDRYPVLITQHMPATFTTILAEHLARNSQRMAHEGIHGEIVKPGTIYLAPGGKHMKVVAQGADIAIVLDDGPPVNFCKPAVDPMFASAAQVWHGAVLGVVLTGMGADGARGGKDIVAAGGNVIAQDEASSVVWGMPGAAAQAGICSAVLPLDQIAAKIIRIFAGDRK